MAQDTVVVAQHVRTQTSKLEQGQLGDRVEAVPRLDEVTRAADAAATAL